MTRVDITLGLLSVIGAIVVTALVGVSDYGLGGEGAAGRMAKTKRGYDVRSVETGAQLFDQYCKACHGANAAGANCPPLGVTSGLHGGDIAPGVAWRLEEQHWDRGDARGYVYSIISAGRTLSTRPDRYRGLDANVMQMPAWSQEYGGPLRPDQIRDLTSYVVNFREFFPAADAEGAAEEACTFVLDQLEAGTGPAPTVAGYESTCYETLCAAAIKETDPDFVVPKEPKEPVPSDVKFEGDAAAYEAARLQYVKDRAARDAFWRRCEAEGGRVPEVGAAVEVTATVGVTGTVGVTATASAGGTAEGTPGSDSNRAGTGTPGGVTTGTPEAGEGSPPTATRTATAGR